MDHRYEWLGADSNEEGSLHSWCDDIDFNLELMSLVGLDRVAAYV